MIKTKATVFILLLAVSANFLYAREASNPRAKQDSQRFSEKDYSKDSRVNQIMDRPHLTKGQLIHAAINRERSRNNLEPLLKSEFDEQYPGIEQVPGGGDIFDAWHVTFDTEADFLSFELDDLSGDGNDWFWNEVAAGDPANAAVAPEPPLGETREEGIRVKVGVPKESTAGLPYRVAQLQTDVLVDEGDPDDFLEVGVLEGPKWHLDDFGSHTTGDSVWWVGDKKWDTWGYANVWLQYLDTNPIDLTGTTAPTLSINTTWILEGPSSAYGWDAATVFALSSADADYDTWTEIVPASGYTLDNMFAWNLHWAIREGPDVYDATSPGDYTDGNHGGWGGDESLHPGEGWHTETFDLTPFIGQTIIIRFALAVDECYSNAQSSCEDPLEGDGNFDGGWWLDDINVNDGGGANLVTALTPDHDGPGFEPEPWVELDSYSADDPGTGSWQAAYDITRAIIGSFDDSLTVGFLASYDADNTAAPDGGFEVSDALLQIYTRLEEDAGATFVDLVDAAGDSALQDDGYALVGATYDPVTTIENFGLTDIPIWSAYLEIENSFGDLVYEEFSYQYNDTLEMYPDSRDFTFPAWTVAYEGDYTVRAYFDLFGGDDEPLNDAIEYSFHAYGAVPTFTEDFNAPTDDSTLFANGWEYASTQGDTSFFIWDGFGEGDTEIWWYTAFYGADSMNETVITPPVDLTGTTDNALSFGQYLNNTASFGPEGAWTLEILGRPDATTAWTVLNAVNGATAYALRYAPYRLDISAFDGAAAFQAGFRFRMSEPDSLSDTPTGYATIDDVFIYADADLEGPAAGPANVLAVSGDMEATVSWDPVTALDVMNYSLYGAYYIPGCDFTPIVVAITPDNYPGETSWDITDAFGEIVAAGDAEGGTACLEAGNYTLTMYDLYGDGMCCDYGTGSYTLTAGGVVVIDVSGTDAGGFAAQEHDFTVVGTAPIDPDTSDSELITTNSATELTFTDVELDNGVTYFYWLTATDHNGNESASSDTASVIPADVTAPTTVMDLSVINVSPTSSLLEWSAPVETVPEEGSFYEVRWAHSPINDEGNTGEGDVDWHDAAVIEAGFHAGVAAAGDAESLLVEGLIPGLDTYFALKTIDEAWNESEMSNVVNNDHIPPAMIEDLEIAGFDENSITFSWTAPGDDGNHGVAAEYDFRLAFGGGIDWETAVPASGEPTPALAGSEQTLTVTEDIYPSFAMAFGLKAVDNNGNESPLSNVVVWRPNGIVPSEITEVSDIPDDQGQQVRVSWTASDNEGDDGALNVQFYSLWREIEGSDESASVNVVAGYLELFEAAGSAVAGDRFRVLNPDNRTNSEWDFIATVPAHDDDMYHYVAPTLYDSTIVDGQRFTTFMVSAHSELGYLTNSAPVSGYSVDNLAPEAPVNVAADDVSDPDPEIGIVWQQNDEPDLSHYSLYKSVTAGVYGEPLLSGSGYDFNENLVEYIDPDVTPGVTYYYVATATDVHGNESEFSSEVSAIVEIVSVDDLAGIPTEFALKQNYPNPFNPTTAINFALPEDANVVLIVYNMLGQEVRLLANGEFSAGYHRVAWNGKDDFGRTVTSGMYFYRITADDFSRTMKMVFLK